TREHVPVLAIGNGLPAGDIGARATFADIGQTLAVFFGLEPLPEGESFLRRRERRTGAA
ncbi:MAG: phosphopentomutase, partial [Gammaproteobacteria bacterium]|nr:phosphopentomutase [Gammaproteobacteria bacterium]